MSLENTKKYMEHIHNLHKIILEKESANIESVVKKIAETVQQGNSIWVFGASHAGILTEELVYRAGGSPLFNPIFSPTTLLSYTPITITSQYEQLEGNGVLLYKSYPIKSGDFLLIHSVSGRNAIGIDLALEAKNNNVYIVGITNMEYSQNTTSRHSSGKHLFEICDLVIDNHGEIGDACIKIDGVEEKIAPTSSATGIFIVNSILLEFVQTMLDQNQKAPIFYSANRDEGAQRNQRLMEQYAHQIHYL